MKSRRSQISRTKCGWHLRVDAEQSGGSEYYHKYDDCFPRDIDLNEQILADGTTAGDLLRNIMFAMDHRFDVVD